MADNKQELFNGKCLELARHNIEFEPMKDELFKKYDVEGNRALYALAYAFCTTNRTWEVEEVFVDLLPLFTCRPFFDEFEFYGEED